MTMNQPYDISLLIFLSAILLYASIHDIRTQKIPNVLTFSAVLVSISYNAIFYGWSGFLFSISGMFAGVGLLIVPYLLGGMGAGDAKLLGVVGSVLGAKGVLYAFLFIAIIGGIYSITFTLYYRQHFKGFYKKLLQTLISFLLFRKYIPVAENSALEKPRLCYGVVITIGAGIYIFCSLSEFHLIS